MAILNLFRIFSDIKRLRSNANHHQETREAPCPICSANAPYLDTLDFNKSCEEVRGKLLPPKGIFIDYYLCDQCGFCFAPEFHSWSLEEFEQHIYNKDYEIVDPDYRFDRPNANANNIEYLFGASKQRLRHLDYGGGSGLTSNILRQKDWDSETYDPLENRDKKVEELGTFDLITAFEVFEHVPDTNHLFDTLKTLCKPDGLVLFSTLLSDGNIARSQKLNWWYAAPRNGHISLFSHASLSMMMARRGLQFVSLSAGLHMAFSQLPEWASHVTPLTTTSA